MDIINAMRVGILTQRHTVTSYLYPKGTLYHIYHPRITFNNWFDCIAMRYKEKQLWLWSNKVKLQKLTEIEANKQANMYGVMLWLKV